MRGVYVVSAGSGSGIRGLSKGRLVWSSVLAVWGDGRFGIGWREVVNNLGYTIVYDR